MDSISHLICSIAQVGREHPSYPPLHAIETFEHFYRNSAIDYEALDRRDGACTRREVLLRFLLLCAVLDQGPDIAGVRDLLVNVTNELYRREVRFLHKPLLFFQEIGLAIDQILEKHETVKGLRAEIWGKANQANPERYNLFMDNAKQALNYAIFRWGVPLALPLLLDRDCADEDKKPSVFADYLETWPSAEIMSQQLKDHQRYGLGKAIGDKACHLFAKWIVAGFSLVRKKEPGWADFSFEVPYDSNAGRVLWRTGFLLHWASEEEYIKREVVQVGRGKQGLHYIRVTNIRGMPTGNFPGHLYERYADLAMNYLKVNKRPPNKVEIQRIQHVYLLENYPVWHLCPAHFDDGLIHIGTHYCFNHNEPACPECPISGVCEGYQANRQLIEKYRT